MTTAAEVLRRGPDRVVVDAEGEAAIPSRARERYGVEPVVIFVRGDGWSLGAPREFADVAFRTWSDEWVGYVILGAEPVQLHDVDSWQGLESLPEPEPAPEPAPQVSSPSIPRGTMTTLVAQVDRLQSMLGYEGDTGLVVTDADGANVVVGECWRECVAGQQGSSETSKQIVNAAAMAAEVAARWNAGERIEFMVVIIDDGGAEGIPTDDPAEVARLVRLSAGASRPQATAAAAAARWAGDARPGDRFDWGTGWAFALNGCRTVQHEIDRGEAS